MSAVWAFNRRVVEDQTIYVRAATLTEAWRKAHDEEGFNTSDPEIVRITYRRTPRLDEGAALTPANSTEQMS